MAEMQPSPDVSVSIDLPRVRRNAESISSITGRPVLAVMKADAYGLGAEAVAAAVADVVAGFYVFRPREAIDARLERFTHTRVIALHCDPDDADELRRQRIHPVVWDVRRAKAYRAAKPVLSIDTGQGRFGCEPRGIRELIDAGDVTEAMTHATTAEHADRFAAALLDLPEITFRHAAGSALLAEPAAWFDAVRPGLALYEGAVRVTARLVEARDSLGNPAGYTGFVASRYGVIFAGYSNGLRAGPCCVNGRMTRLLEVGMQSSFVELSTADRVGDEVELLGAQCTARVVAAAWAVSPQEVLFRLAGSGRR